MQYSVDNAIIRISNKKFAKGRYPIIKPDFVKELKQTNVSENAEKTMERLRSIWMSITAPEREEILSLTGLKKASIQRAYKTGNVSAKILAAVAQVLSIDPYYLAGMSDEQRPFDNNLLIQFLTELNYEVGKSDIIKRRKVKTESVPPVITPVDATQTKDSYAREVPIIKTAPSPGQIDFAKMFEDLSKLDTDSKDKLDKLAEDDLILMLKSLTVQASFNEDKRSRFALVKYLLLT